jgi:hypothetical protein
MVLYDLSIVKRLDRKEKTWLQAVLSLLHYIPVIP